MDDYFAARSDFTTDEWIDLLIQSLGFEPAHFSRRQKFIQLLRLVPFIERNYNLIELGPKGTGKSHVYSEFSPDGMLISGGEITVAKLFVNNSSGKLGLVAYWNVVAFDEFAGRTKTSPKALVDILKNYMANRSFSRGVETITAEASMVFVGNTDNTVAHMLEHDHLFSALPSNYIDSAFLDRVHCYLPGWESDMIRKEMFTTGFGLVVDFFAGVLKALRDQDLSNVIQDHFRISNSITTRDTDGVKKTFSGLFKLIFPHGQATQDEVEELLQVSMEGRRRVKDQLYRLDPTISEVEFTYSDQMGGTREVICQEQIDFPEKYKLRPSFVEDIPADAFPVLSPMNAESLIQLLIGKQDVQLVAPLLKTELDFSALESLVEGLGEASGSSSISFEVVTNLEDLESDQELQIEALDRISDNANSRGVAFSYSFDAVPGDKVRAIADGTEIWAGPLR
jgi:ATP-dependent Lon protease